MTTPDSARVEPEDPPELVATTVEELAPLYRQMLAIRRLEEASAKAYSQGKIGGFLHLIIGQESVCVGATAGGGRSGCTWSDRASSAAYGAIARWRRVGEVGEMDSRNSANGLTITQAEQSTARTNVCGTRVSGDPGAASFWGGPSAAMAA